jgi:mannose-6-phosphate isomerase
MDTLSDTALEAIVRSPIFFEQNRVSRTYAGGRLLEEMSGAPAADGYRPEEWIASTTSSRNAPSGSESSSEGLSVVRGCGILFRDLVRMRREELVGPRDDLGILVKYIDSAVRLAVQVHPDRAMAKKLFGSENGKTEMWVLLAARPGARLFIGLKDGVGHREFAAAFDEDGQRPGTLARLLNEVPARPGEAWIIPGRTVHAIGAGCLILEVQEPTDLVFRLERRSGERALSDFEMFNGLDRAAALDCVDFSLPAGEGAIRSCRLTGETYEAAPNVQGERILGSVTRAEFSASRYRLGPSSSFELRGGPSVFVVASGSGKLLAAEARSLRRGDYFFLPAAARGLSISSEQGIELIECLPPVLEGAR